MKISKQIISGIVLLGVGGLAGWTLRPVVEGDPPVPLAEYGGTVNCGFNAEVTWHPETEIKGENFVLHETTWKWVFHNRSDAPIQFSIPRQKLHLDRSIYSSEYIDLPESMRVEVPITIAPGEKREYTARSNGMSWHKAKNGEFGFQMVAKVNDTFLILGCAANVRAAAKGDMANGENK